jgi:hypothetical protein
VRNDWRWYHIRMKLFWTLAGITCVALTLPGTTNPQLKAVSSVYVLAMRGGMDQYLANQLTNAGVVRVVADPKKADAIFTDRLGESFEKKLNELYPSPPTPEQLKKEQEESENKEPRRGFDMSGVAVGRPASSFSSAQGNYFLVDRASRTVVWSFYQPPAKDSSPASMTRIASRVVRHLEADISGKKAD